MIRDTFSTSSKNFHQEYLKLENQSKALSTLRIVFTLLAITIFVIGANNRNGTVLILVGLIYPFLFGVLINIHNKLKFRRDHNRFLSKLNQDEIDRLDFNWDQFDTGEEFGSASHPYSADLDIFGKHSLFQLLNRTATITGKDFLANWLTSPFPEIKEIHQRQEAVKELTPLHEWRLDLQALALHINSDRKHNQRVMTFLKNKQEKGFRLPLFLIYGLSLISILLLSCYFLDLISGYVVLADLVFNGFLLKKIFGELLEHSKTTSESYKLLKSYSRLINKVENTQFNSVSLQELKNSFFTKETESASIEIKKIEFLLDWINSRANVFFALLNVILMFDFHLLNRLDQWKKKNGEQVERWILALSNIESLNSLAGFAYANPEFEFPVIHTHSAMLAGKEIGHPLIPASKRISNDFSIQNTGNIALITGSNMSGKSTFQRTLGINSVLALIGSPVCAKSLEIGVFELYTSMRISDNLDESISSFYAELKRIKGLIDLLETTKRPVFFMLDEILKGTNSADRHAGAEALIHQLAKTNSLGLISTHDVELGKLASEYPYIQNFNFDSYIQEGQLVFDYKIKQGVCQSFNATVLMKKMGIEMMN